MSITNKLKLHNFLKALLQERIDLAQEALQSTIASRDNESKSTAGDKYETGRAMMQIAQQQNEVQLSAALNLLQHLKVINPEQVNKKIGLGSLVATSEGIFYISIGLGEIKMDEQAYLIVSLASPIAQILQGKTTGDTFNFRQKEYIIHSVF